MEDKRVSDQRVIVSEAFKDFIFDQLQAPIPAQRLAEARERFETELYFSDVQDRFLIVFNWNPQGKRKLSNTLMFSISWANMPRSHKIYLFTEEEFAHLSSDYTKFEIYGKLEHTTTQNDPFIIRFWAASKFSNAKKFETPSMTRFKHPS